MPQLTVCSLLDPKSNLLHHAPWKRGGVGRSRVLGWRKGEGGIMGFVYEIIFWFRSLWVFLLLFHTHISLLPDSFVICWPFPSSLPADDICLPWWQATSLTIHLPLASCLYVLSICLFQILFSVPHLPPVLTAIHPSPLKSEY